MSEHLIARLLRSVGMMVGRAIIRLSDDSQSIQTLQLDLLRGETQPRVTRFQEYGFTSNPLPGAEAAVIFLGGARSQGLVIATEDRRYRLVGMQGGEVALYTDEGDHIWFKRGRVIEMTAGTKVVMNTPRLEVTGDIIDQTGTGNAHTVKNMRDIYNGHHHSDPQGGSVGVPDTLQ